MINLDLESDHVIVRAHFRIIISIPKNNKSEQNHMCYTYVLKDTKTEKCIPVKTGIYINYCRKSKIWGTVWDTIITLMEEKSQAEEETSKTKKPCLAVGETIKKNGLLRRGEHILTNCD